MNCDDPRQRERVKGQLLAHVQKGVIYSLLENLLGAEQAYSDYYDGVVRRIFKDWGYFLPEGYQAISHKTLVENSVPVVERYPEKLRKGDRTRRTEFVMVDSFRMPTFSWWIDSMFRRVFVSTSVVETLEVLSALDFFSNVVSCVASGGSLQRSTRLVELLFSRIYISSWSDDSPYDRFLAFLSGIHEGLKTCINERESCSSSNGYSSITLDLLQAMLILAEREFVDPIYFEDRFLRDVDYYYSAQLTFLVLVALRFNCQRLVQQLLQHVHISDRETLFRIQNRLYRSMYHHLIQVRRTSLRQKDKSQTGLWVDLRIKNMLEEC